MNSILKHAYENELSTAKEFYQSNDFEKSFYHLERAHILGQKNVVLHTVSHVWMLKIGVKTRCFREVFAQLIRIPFGIIGSAVGVVPIGNTGGSNVSATKKMQIPADLLYIIDQSKNQDT